MTGENVALVTFYEVQNGFQFREKVVPMILAPNKGALKHTVYQSIASPNKFMQHVEFNSRLRLYQFQEQDYLSEDLLETLVENQESIVYVATSMKEVDGNATTLGLGYNLKSEFRDEFIKECQNVLGSIGSISGHLKSDVLVDTNNQLRIFVYSSWSSPDTFRNFISSDVFKGVTQRTKNMITGRPTHHLYRTDE